MQLLKLSLNDILVTIKHADAFFKKMGVDMDADRYKILAEVFSEKKVDVGTGLEALAFFNNLAEKDVHWLMEPTANLINYITSRYHQRHRAQLPTLISLAEQIEAKHRASPLCPIGLANYLKELQEDLLAHMEKEEQWLFPFLSEEKKTHLFTQVSLAMHSHDHHLHILSEIDEITNGFTLPEDACAAWKDLYGELTIFKADLLEHIRLENDILFEKCHEI